MRGKIVYLCMIICAFCCIQTASGQDANKPYIAKVINTGGSQTTDHEHIRESIKTQFGEWCKKGEFEKVSDQAIRIKEKSKEVFESICYAALASVVEEKANTAHKYISTYDSEKEQFPLTFAFPATSDYFSENGISVAISYPVSIKLAPQFKENFSSMSMRFGKDWCFNNGMLLPKEIFLIDDSGTEISIPLAYSNETPVVFTSNDVGLVNGRQESFKYVFHGMKEKEQEEKVYTLVESPPIFPGGEAALLKYISTHLKYPESAAEKGIQGRVILRFVVLDDGRVGDVVVASSLDPDCDREAIRVIKSLPRFIPGKHQGRPVKVWLVCPLLFQIQEDDSKN